MARSRSGRGIGYLDARFLLRANPIKPAAALFENIPRATGGFAAVNPLSSGRLHLTPLYLPAGTVVTNISFYSNTQALVTPTNLWFALFDKARVLLRQTADEGGSAAWAASALKTLALTTPYTIPTSDVYLIGLMAAAATPPSLTGGTMSITAVASQAPVYNGSSSTGLTDTAPNPAGAITASPSIPYCFVG